MPILVGKKFCSRIHVSLFMAISTFVCNRVRLLWENLKMRPCHTVDRGLRFSRNDRTVKVIKLFFIFHQQQKRMFFLNYPLLCFLQAHDRPVGITGE